VGKFDWAEIEKDWKSGAYESLKEFAAQKGLNYDYLRKKAAGWGKDKITENAQKSHKSHTKKVTKKAGRKKKIVDYEELEDKINEYFEWCDKQKEVIKTDKGVKVIHKPYTISGLCVCLDIDKSTLLRWENEEQFCNTIKKAKMRIENWIEEKSLTGELNPTVSIFNLKNNFKWRDKDENTKNTLSDELEKSIQEVWQRRKKIVTS
jgi:hypothetical protein